MAYDVFLRLDGIPGESTDAKHKDEIEVLSFSFGVSQAGGGAGGGGGAGKASLSDLHFVARTQKSSPRLFVACAAGEHVKQAVLTARKAGGKQQQDFFTLTLREVRVTSYQAGGSAEADDGPLDQVTLGYGRIEIEYRPQDPKGSLGPPVKGGWDLKANKKV